MYPFSKCAVAKKHFKKICEASRWSEPRQESSCNGADCRSIESHTIGPGVRGRIVTLWLRADSGMNTLAQLNVGEDKSKGDQAGMPQG